MIFRITLISDEADDFIREIKIDSDATFYDLHQAILQSCHYQDNQITSFFLCNDEWEKEQEVVLEDMGTTDSDEDLYLMRETSLSDLLEDEKQKMIYVFDPLNERVFFMEISEIIFGERMQDALCSKELGMPPVQTLSGDMDFNPDYTEANKKKDEESDEQFYGDEGFDNEEFDPEGFEISEGNPY